MPKGQTSKKISKEKQYFDDELLYSEDADILECYTHFKDRYRERYINLTNPTSANDGLLSYLEYWNSWIVNLRGDFLYYDKGRMIRLIGSYIKDEILFKIVYAKNIKLNIFIPLTIVDVKDKKKKLILYKRLLSLKRKNENTTNS
jgi:hypothetical protein